MVRECKSKDSEIPKVKRKTDVARKSKNFKTAARQLVAQTPKDSFARASTSSINLDKQISPKKNQDGGKRGGKASGSTKATTCNNSSMPCSSSVTSTAATDEDGMEWQPSEIEVMQSVSEIRKGFLHSTVVTDIPSSNHDARLVSSSADPSVLHVVIDTNIFLSHLTIVESLVNRKDSLANKVKLYVPWMVLQELDFMKTKREDKVKLELLARKAAAFINEQVTGKKNSIFRIQTLDEFKSCINLLPDENADDKILQWCLKLHKEMKDVDVFLLSNDIIFCAKASACGIRALQSEQFKKQLPQLLADLSDPSPAEVTSPAKIDISSDSIPSSSSSESSVQQSYANVVVEPKAQRQPEEHLDDGHSFLHEFERILLDPLSHQLLEYEMEKAFNDMWQQIVLVKPPWTFLPDVFRCVEKHWIAVFSYVYPKDLKDKCDYLNSLLKVAKKASSIDHAQRETLVTSAVAILRSIQRSRKQFYAIIESSILKLQELILPALMSPERVLDLFSRLWERFQFLCGTLADATGIPHFLQYEPGNSIPDRAQASDGLRMLLPLMTELECTMSRYLQAAVAPNDAPTLESAAAQMSDSLLSSINRLSIPVESTSSSALSRALVHFVSSEQQKVDNGLQQLRSYIQILLSVSTQLNLPSHYC